MLPARIVSRLAEGFHAAMVAALAAQFGHAAAARADALVELGVVARVDDRAALVVDDLAVVVEADVAVDVDRAVDREDVGRVVPGDLALEHTVLLHLARVARVHRRDLGRAADAVVRSGGRPRVVVEPVREGVAGLGARVLRPRLGVLPPPVEVDLRLDERAAARPRSSSRRRGGRSLQGVPPSPSLSLQVPPMSARRIGLARASDRRCRIGGVRDGDADAVDRGHARARAGRCPP